MSILVLILSVLLGYALAANVPRSSDCVGTIASLDDVAAAQECSTVNIEGFTVPAGEGFTLSLIDGATVNLQGDVLFGNMSWTGPLFTISGNDITFNGNGHRFDGGGPFYWDGLGSNGGITKPRPMLKIKMSGRFSDLYVVNSPAQTFSVSNPGPLVISSVTVDDSQGDYPNAQSNGLAAGHNTDGFDVSTTDLTIENRSVHNQDDCIAINEGSNIVFTNNVCTGGHGISIGSITSNRTVSGVVISNNHIANEQQAIRIKTDAVATNSSVSNITYSGNTATNLTKFGILIDQSYPSTLGVPGAGVKISNINFIEAESIISVASGADRVAVNCAVGGCLGTWDWSSLTVSGGKAGPINNFTGIEGFSQ
ncbi:endo-polygalacturonase PG1 [Gloeophyllum trabeum ATCC 11539]|uniref:endo-polygalacturonase n=1 Tax=Gloeophyllum trabeum (strain ATCC 11539 / FP-39264 / Madison 617) TaxID=670483 RepID=S7QDH7_GLOTA|nr:endo-polygalacturonase PG1 [Gloeophyllum trabeum ATCC 11539]EPQ57443.1 endo-polygalacturonase PG1 [Gloeophyllum trabeum ATCC 11539]